MFMLDFIGSLFTNTSIIIKTAYRYEMEKYNNSTASTAFKLEKYDKTADFFDSYDVSRASETIILSLNNN